MNFAYNPAMRMLTLKTALVGATLGVWVLGSCQREPAAKAEAAAARQTDALDADAALGADTAAQQATQVTWHRLQQATSRKAPLIRYAAVRRPAALDTAAPPPSEARLFDLTLKPSEFFRIDPTQPAEVRGREGTVVRIPANALVDARQQTPRGAVWVELKECYSLTDLLLSNCVSMSVSGDALQASGMLLVRATTARGQQLRLAEGRALELVVPSEQRHPGLQLYHSSGRTPKRWAAAPVPADEEQVLTEAQTMPSYGSGPEALSRLVRYPASAAERKTEGFVFASFVVDEAGRVQSPKVLRGLGDGCDEEALRVLQQSSGHWLPGRQGSQAVKVKMVVPIRFTMNDAVVASAESTAVAAAPAASEFPAAPAAPAEPAPEPGSMFRSGRLGWLTCLRPWRTASQTTSFTVAADVDEHTTVRLVYPDSPVILEGEPQADGYSFAQVPAQQRAVLVGLRYFNGSPYIAMREVVPGSGPVAPLEFKESTLGDLEQLLERLR
ncbi:energy transducer TonB [Hymenobacter oligotrophus]|uniref:Energy transducer TonB n=2 Tax=Hymenobacter oligotrophus TaxID=2319843 RepID=A0A3B7R3X2_9BACT|nr:energy transducer TonB [Hymenobacter oligotrophus]